MNSLRDLWINIRYTNVYIIRVIRVLEGQKREKGREKIIEEIMTQTP